MASQITFHYFHGRGIGEPIRLLFTVGNIEFEDKRYGFDEFASMTAFKALLPFGQIPVLEIDGNFIGQTDSIARLAARLANLYPSAPIEAARSDMIVVHQAEIQSALAKMSYDGVPGAPGTKMVPADERQKKIGAWFETNLPNSLQRLESLANDKLMVGNSLSWADVCVFNRMNQLLEIDDTVLAQGYPKLRQVYAQVAALDEVQQWVAQHPDDYPRPLTA